MGHRVYKDEGDCGHLHGHSYVAMFHARADRNDGSVGVVDPAILRDDIGGWIDDQWDNGFVLWKDDPLIEIWGVNVRLTSTNFEVEREGDGADLRD